MKHWSRKHTQQHTVSMRKWATGKFCTKFFKIHIRNQNHLWTNHRTTLQIVSLATVLKSLGSRVKIVRFIHSEKAKKYDKISKHFLTLLSNFNKTLEISTKFAGLLRIYELYNKKLRFLFEFNSSLNRQTKRPCRILHGLTLLWVNGTCGIEKVHF